MCTAVRECPGVAIDGRDACLAHLGAVDRAEALASLTSGADVDFRGVTFSGELWREVIIALGSRFGSARFDVARFVDVLHCEGIQFSGPAYFEGATFEAEAWFDGAEFADYVGFDASCFAAVASFRKANFRAEVRFIGTRFECGGIFDAAHFSSVSRFSDAGFGGGASFRGVGFAGQADFAAVCFRSRAEFTEVDFGAGAGFEGVRFQDRAIFSGATFGGALIGPVVCSEELWLQRATFRAPLRVGIAALRLDMDRMRCESTAVFHLRFARVSMGDAMLAEPVTVLFQPTPFSVGAAWLEEDLPREESPSVSMRTLAGVDLANLVLANVDLSRCVFSGAYNLDQIRLAGRCRFGAPPTGLVRCGTWSPIRWWTRRRVVAEEQYWRALPLRGRTSADTLGWVRGLGHPDPAQSPKPDDVAIVYRQLRKALEDAKNEPGASDFYYGEMEMRRLNPETPRGERFLLHAYWLLSGYGLRASRAMSALMLAMAVTVVVLMMWGIPMTPSAPRLAGDVPTGGGRVVLTGEGLDPRLDSAMRKRWTLERLERAGRVVMNSVVFRSSGQDLTKQGAWIEMASRLGEPILLGFVAVAARGRVKR